MKDSTGVTVHSKLEYTLHAMPEVVCRSILNCAKPLMMQVEGKYHMKRKEEEDNERMPGVLRLTEIPSEEPLRTHSKRRDTAQVSCRPFSMETDITHNNTSILI